MSLNVRPNLLASILFVFLIQKQDGVIADSLIEYGSLNFTQLAGKYGRQVEVHDVLTQDKYIVQLHRLVGNQSRPLLLWHGILDSSDTFILRGFNSTAVAMSEAGYDVWLGNSRGNRYTRRHYSMDPDKDTKFWDFSFHEMGYYDLPAAIDFILETTRQKSLSAVGHSQGNTMFYVLGSTRPEYNIKVNLLTSLAPVAYLSHLRHLANVLAIWPVASGVLALAGAEELLRFQSPAHKLIKEFCSQGTFGYDLCLKSLAMGVTGRDPEELGPEFFKVLLEYFPSGTSKKVVDHFAQISQKKKLSQFDYGPIQNILKYGAVKAPVYELGKVTMPVALLCGMNDNIATTEDVQRLRAELPNVVNYTVMDRKEFNHIDFNVGRSVNVYVNPLLIKLLRDYSNN